ncbi:hypothetical protein FA13DRAFT_1690790 [Coprinellus micaceus]|uniref:Uncharacterized protein n=1 Tax=Coprinellus micaceus TaxID=71717 RepID=A0A4Y7T1W4_COPMI|nr:hypothetical protein FA13DRAFT_1690790 [Coprinellus micaceus]
MQRPLDAMDVDLPPAKRQRTEDGYCCTTPMDGALTTPSSSKPHSVSKSTLGLDEASLDPLPLPVLLLSLSSVLMHPPTHRHYAKSLYMSFLSTLKCTESTNLDPDMECRAWTGLAELGFRLGLGEEGVEAQVEVAITKALLISQNHPTLRPYKVHLTVLSSRLSLYQHKPKLAQNSLKRLLSSFLTPADPPHLVYTAHLAHIASFSVAGGEGSEGVPTAQSLKAIRDMNDVAVGRGDESIVKLAAVLRLHTLVQMGSWDTVLEALSDAESLLSFPSSSSSPSSFPSTPADSTKHTSPAPPTQVLSESAAVFAHAPRPTHDTAFLVYTLVLGIVYYTYVGETPSVEARTKVLHEVLDGGGLDGFGWGSVEIPFPGPVPTQPLHVALTHPRILMSLAFLLTAVAKRDPVGRKPKRKVFAEEGLRGVERELRREASLAPWASAADVEAHYGRLNKMKADLICELVGVSIARSDLPSASSHLSQLTAHTRSSGLFNAYAARLALLHAQMAHAQGKGERAVRCYRVAGWLSRAGPRRPCGRHDEDLDAEGVEDPWIHAAARAGELWVRIGHLRKQVATLLPEEIDHEVVKAVEEGLREDAEEGEEGVVKTCEGLGCTLNAVACVVKACLADEFLEAKMHLRKALTLSTQSSDNHLRALVMALIASQYLNTSSEHAEAMLATAEQLAAGLGAQPRPAKASGDAKAGGGGTPTTMTKGKTNDGVGNAALRLWIGERSAELKRRAGEEEAARAQDVVNERLRGVQRRIEEGGEGEVGGTPVKEGGQVWRG